MNNINLQPGLNGLPPVKAQSSDYDEDEKIIIARAAREYGVMLVAEVYDVKWQSVSAWMKKKCAVKQVSKSTTAETAKTAEFTAKATNSTKNVKTANKNNKNNKKTADVVMPNVAAPTNVAIKFIIQSPSGQEITPNEIMEKLKAVEMLKDVGEDVGAAETIEATGEVSVFAYIRPDENAVYLVRGEEHGSVNLW